MTDKVQKIREEVERRFIENELNYKAGDETELHRMVEDKAIITFIDSLQEETVSEDLEEATNNYCVNVRKGYPRVKDETDIFICNAFIAGAKWQKEKDQKK